MGIKELPTRKELEEGESPLSGVLSWVQKKKTAAQGKGSTSLGWIGGLVAAAVVFFGLAFAAWSAWKRGKEIAKLKHKLDVQKENQRKLNVKETLSKSKSAREKLQQEAIQLKQNIAVAEDRILKAEEERKKVHRVIDEITSWEDVDKLIGAKDG